MTRYEQGFLKKCAEYGVDGRKLLKRADYYEDLRHRRPLLGRSNLTGFQRLLLSLNPKDRFMATHDYYGDGTVVPPPKPVTPGTARTDVLERTEAAHAR